MAVRSKDEILEAVKNQFADSTDDNAIALLEDLSDTFTELESWAIGAGEDWKSKYEENDRAWREKYTNRFFSKEPEPKLPEPVTETEPTTPKSFVDLFTTL